MSKFANAYPLIALIVGVALSLGFFLTLERYDDERIQNNLRNEAISHVFKLDQSADFVGSLTASVKLLYDSSNFVDRNEFETFSKPLMETYEEVDAITWLKKITSENLQQIKEEAKADGIEDFQLKKISPNGELVSFELEDDQSHLIIFYALPHDLNDILLGFDSSLEKERYIALEKSFNTKKIAATPVITLASGREGIVFYAPVFKKEAMKRGEYGGIEDLDGIVSLVIYLDEFIDNAFGGLQNQYHIKIEDITDPDNISLVSELGDASRTTDFEAEYTNEFAGRRWRTSFRLLERAYLAQKSSVPKITFICGFIFSIFMSFLLYVLIKRREVVEKLVKEKSTELETQRLHAVHSSRLSILGEMSAGVAHEINNPLTVIAGKTEMLRHLIKKGDLEKAEDHLSKIDFSVGRISKIVNGLKKFSKNSDEDERTRHSVRNIINDAVEMTNHSVSRNDILLEAEIETDDFILCNRVEIEQVLINLIMNAVDAVKDLDTRWIRIHAVTEGGWVKIFVTDSGDGISDVDIPNLFNPFFSKKKTGEGTGLGLSISMGIIEEHAGKIYYNAESTNTCFVVELKAHKD